MIRAQFGCEMTFREHGLFRLAPKGEWKKGVKQQVELDAILDNPFPIRRIVRFDKIDEVVSLVCKLPDKLNPVTLPFLEVKALHHELVAKFRAATEKVLIGPD
jgi:uncharacterized protein YdgA (DUF945 family)